MAKTYRWISNIYNPKSPYANLFVTRLIGQSHAEAVEAKEQWLANKYLGAPKGSETYSALELSRMGMVGVYVLEEVSDELSN